MKNQIEKKTMKIIFIAFAMAIFLSTTRVFAEDNFYNNKPENNDVPIYNPKFDQLKEDNPLFTSKVNCFDYYKFQSVQVNVNPDKEEYQPGKVVKFVGSIDNENNQPVNNGEVFVRISRTDDRNDWENIVDEFVPLKKLSLKPNESKEVKFLWGVPQNITSGNYRADFFFTVGNKFNLGGLSFSNEVIIGSANFKINSNNNSYVAFERNKTKINEEDYHQIGNLPIIEKDTAPILKQVIKNTYQESKKVKITYELYYWDGLDDNNKLKINEEEITIPAQSEKEITYTFPKMDTTVYFLRMTAKTKEQKSIINIRLASQQERPRLNYPAITKFPLKKGEKATLYTCFHNTSAENTTGTVIVTLTDENNNKVSQITYQGNIPSAMFADKADFVAKKNYNKLKLKAEVYNKDKKLVDSYETTYDCQDFNNCIKSSNQKTNNGIAKGRNFLKSWQGVLTIIFIVLIISTIAVVFLKTKKNDK